MATKNYNLFPMFLTSAEYLNNTDINFSNDTQNQENEGTITQDLINKALIWASFRINMISSNLLNDIIVDWSTATATKPPTVNYAKLEKRQQHLVKQAVVFYTDHFLTYGMDWLRGSSSISLGMASVSQTQPTEPDYIPIPVLDCLATADLYNKVLQGQWEPDPINETLI